MGSATFADRIGKDSRSRRLTRGPRILLFGLVVATSAAGVFINDAFGAARRVAPKTVTLKRGQPFPPLAFTAIDGRTVDISRMKGKVVIVEFWATWCGPCVKEMPKMKDIYEKWHDEGLEIVGISVDRELDKLQAYIAENRIPWPQHFQGTPSADSVSRRFGVHAYPTFVLVDQRGTILTTKLRGEDLEDTVAALLSNDPNQVAVARSQIIRVESMRNVSSTGKLVKDGQGNSLEIIGTEPNCPAILKSMDKFQLKIRYRLSTDRPVKIWVKPFAATRAAYTSPSGDLSKAADESGVIDRWVSFGEEAQISQVVATMVDAESHKTILTLYYRCDARWRPADLQ